MFRRTTSVKGVQVVCGPHGEARVGEVGGPWDTGERRVRMWTGVYDTEENQGT